VVNPFKYGKEVSGYRFYDRVQDARKLRRRLADGSTNVVMFAPRRYGKTSLVLKVMEQLRTADSIPGLLFDMAKVTTLQQFCEDYANAAFALFGGKAELLHRIGEYLAHLHPSFSLSGNGIPTMKLDYGERMSAVSISEVLDLPEKLSRDAGNRPLVVAFDEFQEVGELSSEFPLEKIFRSCIQAHGNVRYVFLGSKTHMMKRMFGDHSRPFYKSALPMPLGKPPASESLDFIVTRFAHAGIDVPSEVGEKIVEVAENIPYYIQAVASHAFELVTEAKGTALSLADVETATDEFVGENAALYEAQMRNLSDAKRAAVRALANEPTKSFDEKYRLRHSLPVYSTLHSAVSELIEDGVVESDDSGHRLGDPLFARYVRISPARIFALS
jgi:hypothetical protein